MITKILNRKDPYKVIGYCLKDKEDGIENRAQIIGGNVFGSSVNELAKDFKYALDNEKTYRGKKEFAPIRHLMFNPDDDDRVLTDDEINDITSRWLDEMGYGQCPFLVVKHQDENVASKVHWHVITTNYQLDNKVVNEHRNQVKNNGLCRRLEKDFDLIQGKKLSNNYLQCSQYDAEKRQQHIADRKELNYSQAINAKNSGLGSYYLKKSYGFKMNGIKYCKKLQPNTIKTGLKNGDTITDEKDKIKCSSSDVNENTIQAMAKMAKANGYTKVKVNGSDEFLKKAWKYLEAEGIELNITQKQVALFDQYQQEKEPIENVPDVPVEKPGNKSTSKPKPQSKTNRKRRRRKRTNGYKPKPIGYNKSSYDYDREKQLEDEEKRKREQQEADRLKQLATQQVSSPEPDNKPPEPSPRRRFKP